MLDIPPANTGLYLISRELQFRFWNHGKIGTSPGRAGEENAFKERKRKLGGLWWKSPWRFIGWVLARKAVLLLSSAAAAAAAAKSLQSCLTLCDPMTAAHQAPPSLGFSRQEHWSGLPFPSQMQGSAIVAGCGSSPFWSPHSLINFTYPTSENESVSSLLSPFLYSLKVC